MSLFLKRRKAARSITVGVLLIVALASLAQTQSQQPQSLPQQPMVKLSVLVVDNSKHAVSGLIQHDFRVMEDGVPQKVSFFSKEEMPLIYGLVVDNSGSLRKHLQRVIDTGKNIVAANRPGDETFLVRFVDNKNIKVLQDFTSDKEALSKALDKLFIEGGQTALVDAVSVSAQHVAQHKMGDGSERYRRALILITDGEDRQSHYSQDKLIDFLRRSDIQIFVIGLVEELDNDNRLRGRSPRDRAVKLLDRLAKETGGRAFYPGSSKEMQGVADEIMRDLRTQYIVGYTPANNPKNKPYREVQVTMAEAPGRGKLTAIARAGYTAPLK